MSKVIMQGTRCTLTEMKETYLPEHTAYMNDPEVNRFILSRPPFTLNQQRTWLRGRRKNGDHIHAILVRSETKKSESLRYIGLMELGHINARKQSAISASVIGNRDYWRKGIAREARLMQLKFAFDTLRLRWVYSKTVRPNVRSQRLLESTGYHVIKVLSAARLVNGIMEDEIVYRVSRSAWLPIWNQYLRNR